MEKRFIAWLALSAVIVVVYTSLFGPRPVPLDPAADPLAADGAADAGDGVDAAAPAVGDGDPAADPVQDTNADRAGGHEEPAGDRHLAAAEEEEDELPPRQLVSIGSVDPEGPYRFSATLSNEGAGLVRVELASGRFRDLHARRGYLGHLDPQPSDAEDGMVVSVVPAGTPAATAGLKPGDIINRVGTQQIQTREQYEKALAATRPGETIEIHATRNGVTQPPMKVQVTRRPLEVIRPERENDILRNHEIDDPTASPHSLLLTLAQLDGLVLKPDELELAGVTLRSGRWQIVTATSGEVVFRKPIRKLGLEFTKRFSIAEVPAEERDDPNSPSYHIDLDVTVRNVSDKPAKVAYVLEGPNGLPIEGWWYANRISQAWGGGIRDVLVRFNQRETTPFAAKDIGEEEIEPLSTAPLVYAGVDSQYFTSVVIPEKESLSDIWFRQVEVRHVGPAPGPRDDMMLTNVSFRLIRQPVELQPETELVESYTVYCGPKRPALLSQYAIGSNGEYSLSDFEYYGWNIWAVFAKTMTSILHTFYSWVGNYGLAIVMLTILVRACIFPLSLKQTKSMAKMQELKPELEKIKEKYKNDLEKQARAQRELWSKHGVNPMGGCLLMFLQLPIFIGLYRALMIDIELRQAPLFGAGVRWCSNLAAPDMLWDWSSYLPSFLVEGRGIFVLGPYFNLLPLFTVALFLVQQKMFMPPPTDEQTAMTQKLMKYMTVFIGLLFYKVAAGLCIYFIASSLWGIAERKLLNHSKDKAAQGEAKTETSSPRTTAASRKRSTSSNGQSGGGNKRAKAKRRK